MSSTLCMFQIQQKPVKGVNQISTIWNNPDLRKHFMQIISNTQLRNCPKIRSIFMSKLNELLLGNNNITDETVYDEMYELIHTHIKNSQEWAEKSSDAYRADNRLERLVKILNKTVPNSNINQILDIGCADGKITSKIGRHFGLPTDCIHGCDVMDTFTEDDDINYVHTTIIENQKLPYEDQSMDLVIALMSLHHVQNLNFTLNEIKRVLKPGGLFFIREHNVTSNRLELILDAIHGFYAMVWNEDREIIDFARYYLKYKSAAQWTKLITTYEFEELYNDQKDEAYWKRSKYKDKIPNPLRYYYALYKKE